jgi:myo-inositol catabolism protein IolC
MGRRRLYLLAFDHRASFSRDLLGIPGTPGRTDAERISDLKRLVFEGFLDAVADGVIGSTAGILVDEEFGAEVARSARGLGITLAMPVEKSRNGAELDFAYGDRYGNHLDAFDPAYAKVLVRYDPDGDRELNARQRARLCELSELVGAGGRKLLVDLAAPSQHLDRAVRELQEAGVEPDVWRIDGQASREECERVAEQARGGGRNDVECIVSHRLEHAAPVRGFVGFAVGRSLWLAELRAYLAHEIDRSTAAARISRNYRNTIAAYEAVR